MEHEKYSNYAESWERKYMNQLTEEHESLQLKAHNMRKAIKAFCEKQVQFQREYEKFWREA